MKRKVAKLQNLQASEFTYMLVWDCQPQGVEGSKPSLAAPRMGVDGAQTWHQGTLQSPSRYSHCPLLQDLCPGHSPVKQKMPTCLGGPSPGCTQPETAQSFLGNMVHRSFNSLRYHLRHLVTVLMLYSAQEVVLNHPEDSGPLGPTCLLGSQVPPPHNSH